jgi:hypothetical protein
MTVVVDGEQWFFVGAYLCDCRSIIYCNLPISDIIQHFPPYAVLLLYVGFMFVSMDMLDQDLRNLNVQDTNHVRC